MMMWDRTANDRLYAYGQGATDEHITSEQRAAIAKDAATMARDNGEDTVKTYHINKAIQRFVASSTGAARQAGFYSANHGI